LQDELRNSREFALIHLAAVVGEENVSTNPDSNRVNVDFTVELGKQALGLKLSKFIYVSSSHVYGLSNSPSHEDSNCNPINSYGAQKLAAENGLRKVFKNQPEKLVIVRPFSLLDFGMPDFSLGGVATKIMNSTRPLEVNFSSDVRDFLDLETCANALYSLAVEKTGFQTYNICSGKPLTVKDALTKLALVNGNSLESVEFRDEHSIRPYQVGINDRFLAEHPSQKLKWKYTTNF
jgi:nucleoside-diphosphate-sugar epimerase